MKNFGHKKNLKNIELFCGEETPNNSCTFNYEYIIEVFNLIGRKWELLVITILLNGPKRYGELKKTIPGISEKILSQILKKLKNESIINRKVYDELPIKVEYSLTELGFECSEIISIIYKYGEKLINKKEMGSDQQSGKCSKPVKTG